ncbi:choline/ethanolamine kinase isoform X2 [Anabrus simplex]
MSCDTLEMREKAARLCRDYLHGVWKHITSKDIVLKRISGGMSNYLYHVSLPVSMPPRASEPAQVLLRLYGQIHGEHALEGLITESVIFTLLSERRLGPKLHGIFPGGRLEEYIPARALKTKELSDPRLSPLIAEKMALIHKMNVPISKEPRWLWDTINRWLQNMETDMSELQGGDIENKKCIDKLSSYNLREEAQWLRKFLCQVQSPVVFCHNDMQEGNILLHCDNMTDQQALNDPRLVIIDFEYCSYNYRGFDIANHFLEWTYDYTYERHPFYSVEYSRYPSKEQQLLFIRSYLRTYRRDKQSSQGSADEENMLLKEIKAFTLASHFFWGLWSAVNARLSQIPFGYWDYATDRLESYFYLKNKLLHNPTPSGDLRVKRKITDLEG